MEAMSDVLTATITRQQRVAICVALSLRISSLEERCPDYISPDGQSLWPGELADALSALGAISKAVELKE